MKIKRLFLLLFSLTTLNGCVESTAFLGPAITLGTSGNVYQAGFSYTTNQIVYSTTGKTTTQHVTDFLDPKDEFEGDLSLILSENIEETKKVLKRPYEDFISKVNKKTESITSLILEDQFILF